MTRRRDLPGNRFLARDIKLLEKYYGRGKVHWDRRGRWLQLDRFFLQSHRYRFNCRSTYVVIMVPGDYGERAGSGAGLEEFYIHKDLRIIRRGRPVEIPHTFEQIDRRGGAAVAMRHRYACVHIAWDPRKHTVLTSLQTLALFFSDPWAFKDPKRRA